MRMKRISINNMDDDDEVNGNNSKSKPKKKSTTTSPKTKKKDTTSGDNEDDVKYYYGIFEDTRIYYYISLNGERVYVEKEEGLKNGAILNVLVQQATSSVPTMKRTQATKQPTQATKQPTQATKPLKTTQMNEKKQPLHVVPIPLLLPLPADSVASLPTEKKKKQVLGEEETKRKKKDVVDENKKVENNNIGTIVAPATINNKRIPSSRKPDIEEENPSLESFDKDDENENEKIKIKSLNKEKMIKKGKEKEKNVVAMMDELNVEEEHEKRKFMKSKKKMVEQEVPTKSKIKVVKTDEVEEEQKKERMEKKEKVGRTYNKNKKNVSFSYIDDVISHSGGYEDDVQEDEIIAYSKSIKSKTPLGITIQGKLVSILGEHDKNLPLYTNEKETQNAIAIIKYNYTLK